MFVLPALIGGSALSAAGGVKIARLIVLSRRAGLEFRQLGYRRSVLGFRFRDREMDERSVIGVWVYLIAYILSVFLVMVGFAFTGLPLESSIRLAIGCLTNSGGLVVGHVVCPQPILLRSWGTMDCAACAVCMMPKPRGRRPQKLL